MKLQFKYQKFQAEAANAVVEAFMGQPYTESSDYIMDVGTHTTFLNQGFGNAPLKVGRSDIARNVRDIQIRQGLRPIEALEGVGVNLTVEMETGTGKTYTYIKTIFELNRRYGWSKFIIVVPSVAIREGVYKSFETMQDHFALEYGKRIQYFIYKSKQLSKIDSFASDAGLHVMIINSQAFNTSINEDNVNKKTGGDARIIFSKRDEFGSRRPIDVLARTNPIMIIDEPQSVLGSKKANATRKGIAKFNPLFTLLYSATHREILNMVYRLDALDAYNKKLVKKIEVKAVTQVGSTATNGFVYLEEIVISDKAPQARISFDTVNANGNVRQTSRLVSEGFDLYQQSGGREEYKDNYVVESIDGNERTVRLLNGTILNEGEAVGKINEDAVRRIQIRETIKSHIQRERSLFKKGIKVLSLFFIDHVDNYRTYEKGSTGKGKFAQMFEEEYGNVLAEMKPQFNETDYLEYLNRYKAELVHNGYFSQDKKGIFQDAKMGKDGTGANDENAERAYDLIMKDKERLLSLSEPVRFIFSHSALKEGWDNPNVFQICTLKETANEINKRQEIGRGMRLCVNQQGERQDSDVLGLDGVFDTNILTVVASESYDDFSTKLQSEIADAVADRPQKVTADLFKGMVIVYDGKEFTVNDDMAAEIHESLVSNGYVKKGKLTDKYFVDKTDGKLKLDEDLNLYMDFIQKQLDTIFDPAAVKPENARKPKEAVFQEEIYKKKEFQELWKRINVKTYYKVDFETSELIQKAIKAIDAHLAVTEIRINVTSGAMDKIKDKESLVAGRAMKAGNVNTIKAEEAVGGTVKYDLIGKLVEATGLTRKTIVAILKGISQKTFYQFRANPEEFIAKVGNIINDEKAMAVVQKIAYEKTSNTYDVDVFTESTIRGKIGINAIASVKSLYDMVVVDSPGVEKSFAESLENEEAVVVYTKLPRGFYINTPMGHYNPDWAVAFREGTVKHIYFVAETKGNEWQRSQLRGAEDAKLECAARHFEAITRNDNVVYGVVKDYKTLYDKVMK